MVIKWPQFVSKALGDKISSDKLSSGRLKVLLDKQKLCLINGPSDQRGHLLLSHLLSLSYFCVVPKDNKPC